MALCVFEHKSGVGPRFMS
jgi:hypothetical protein